MLFSCPSCLKTISSKQDECPFCETNTAQASVTATLKRKHVRKKRGLSLHITHQLARLLKI